MVYIEVHITLETKCHAKLLSKIKREVAKFGFQYFYFCKGFKVCSEGPLKFPS